MAFCLIDLEAAGSPMYSEKLSLRVSAERAGWETVEPPTLAGASGVVQRFAFLAVKGPAKVAFDICEKDVDGIDVVRSYIKKVDTGATVVVISSGGRRSEIASRLAADYGMPILSPDEVGSYLSTRIIQLEERGLRP